jgi:hypothetical protein
MCKVLVDYQLNMIQVFGGLNPVGESGWEDDPGPESGDDSKRPIVFYNTVAYKLLAVCQVFRVGFLKKHIATILVDDGNRVGRRIPMQDCCCEQAEKRSKQDQR